MAVSTKTNDWSEAAAFRDLYERSLGLGVGLHADPSEVPTFADFTARYLRDRLSDLAATTQEDRESMLREDAGSFPSSEA